MASLAQRFTSVNPAEILARAGFRNFRRNRCDCVCQSDHRTHFTVAFTGETFSCHRCHRGGSIAALAREQGADIPAYKPSQDEILKKRFDAWLSARMSTLGNEERQAHKKLQFATAGLALFPGLHEIWNWLEWFYARQRAWNQFWALATCNWGRKQLFENWRRNGRR